MGERADEMNAGPRADLEGGELEDEGTSLYFADTDTTLRFGHRVTAPRSAAGDEDVEGGRDEAEQIRHQIVQTRDEMGETIDAIQERLSPDNIKEQVKESVREATIGRVERAMENVGERISNVTEPAVEAVGRAGAAVRETGSSIIDTIRQNPLPAALIGLGVGMLVINRGRGRSDFYGADFDEYGEYDYGHPAGREVSGAQGRSVVGRVQGAVGEAVSGVQETAGSAAAQAREQVGRLGDQVQRGVLRASYQARTSLRENPLAVGAVALALGAAVGLALPATRVESRYMGEARDNLVDKAQQAARDTMQQVQQVAQEAGRTPEGEGQNQAG